MSAQEGQWEMLVNVEEVVEASSTWSSRRSFICFIYLFYFSIFFFSLLQG